jgi:hypothetical protein
MENTPVTITLTIAQWNSILGALSTAPFQVVSQISDAVNALQSAAGPQVEEAAKKAAEEAATAEAAE